MNDVMTPRVEIREFAAVCVAVMEHPPVYRLAQDM